MERDNKGRFTQNREDLTGKKFGRLTAIEFSHKGKNRKTYWLWQCDCGKLIVARTDCVKSGRTQSCGCLKKEQDELNLNRKGGKIKYPDIGPLDECAIYHRWHHMKTRCYNPSHKLYNRYGGRGITVCDDWLMNFYNFYQWCIDNDFTEAKDIHRIDNDKGYSPDNCVLMNHEDHMQLHWKHRGKHTDCDKAV